MNKYLNIFVLTGVLISTPLYPKDIVKDPVTLHIWLAKDFTYQAEIEDIWKTPKQTIDDKGGDCEDFAFLTEYILKDLGYEAQAYWIYGWHSQQGEVKRYSHGICIFKEKNIYKYFSNYSLSNKPFEKIEDIIQENCKDWVWYSPINIKYPKIPINKHWRKL